MTSLVMMVRAQKAKTWPIVMEKAPKLQLQMLMLVPMVPTLMIALNPVSPELWMWATPLYSQALLINQLARGDSLVLAEVALSLGSSLVVVVGLLLVGRQLANRERFVLAA